MTKLYEDPALNVRIWPDGSSKDQKQSLLSYVVSVSTLMLYVGWLHCLVLLALAAIWFWTARILLILIFSTLLLPPKPVLWAAFCHSWVFKTWRDFFNFSFLLEEHFDPKKHYVFVECPHGVFPLSELIAGTLCQVMFPGFDIFSIAASSVFSIPFWRHFTAWIGGMPATASNFKMLLTKGSVAVIIGGIAEMFMVSPKKETIVMRSRKGFVRVAVEVGADGGIVPIYHFGNTQLLDWAPRSAEAISRKLRAAIGFLWGQYGLPLPRKQPLYMVCGKAIKVNKVAPSDVAAFDAEVDRVHALVIEATQALYEKHKAEFGWGDRPLEII